MADLQGMKFRVIQSDIFVDMVAALGANATPMPYGEVYSAIETGVIDGAENNFPSYDTAKHAEVAKYYSLDEHTIVPEVFVMAKTSWDKLTPEDQAIFKQAAKDSVAKQRDCGPPRRRNPREKVEAAGVADHHDTDKQPFIDAMGPVYEKHVTDAKLKELVERHPGGQVSRRDGRRGSPRRHLSRGGEDQPMRQRLRRPRAFCGALSHAVAVARRHRAGADDGLRRLAGVLPLRAQPTPSWTEPGSVMLMSWFIFLGAAVGVRENYHMGFDVLLYVLPASAELWLRTISDLVVFAFGIGMVWYGAQLALDTWNATIPVARHFRAASTIAAGGRRRARRASSRWSASCCAPRASTVDHDPNAEVVTPERGLSAMELWILFGVFTLLMLIGTPIAFCLGVASFATVALHRPAAARGVPAAEFGRVVFSLLAIPFFIYAGDLMVRGGIASRSSPSPARWSAICAAASDRSTSPPRRCSAAFPARRWPKPPPSAA